MRSDPSGQRPGGTEEGRVQLYVRPPPARLNLQDRQEAQEVQRRARVGVLVVLACQAAPQMDLQHPRSRQLSPQIRLGRRLGLRQRKAPWHLPALRSPTDG